MHEASPAGAGGRRHRCVSAHISTGWAAQRCTMARGVVPGRGGRARLWLICSRCLHAR